MRKEFGNVKGMATFRTFILVVAALAVSGVQGAVGTASDKDLSPRGVLRLGGEEVARGGEVAMRGIVTFVSAIDRRFVVAPRDNPRHAGVVVLPEADVARPENGDLVIVAGRIQRHAGLPAVSAIRVDVIRSTTLPLASGAKQADFRRGLLYNRRISLTGTVASMRSETTARGQVTVLGLLLDNYTACVRIPGAVASEGVVGERVCVTGLALNRYAEDGMFLDAELELAGVDAMDVMETDKARKVFIVALCILGAGIVFFGGVSFVLWRRNVQERREVAVVAAERRRMAADLHDTIEQHLAGANLIAAGVLAIEDVPEDVKSAMKTLTGVLANAKAEVRSAVLNLRGDGDVSQSLEEAIVGMVAGLQKTGVTVRKMLRGLPASMSECLRADIVLILREAVTNAVKHGKAGKIVFAADPIPPSGFAIRVLNDGAPFDVDRALGPETGHYGLSGMKERALRNHLSISWGRDGRWTYVRLATGDGNS